MNWQTIKLYLAGQEDYLLLALSIFICAVHFLAT